MVSGFVSYKLQARFKSARGWKDAPVVRLLAGADQQGWVMLIFRLSRLSLSSVATARFCRAFRATPFR